MSKFKNVNPIRGIVRGWLICSVIVIASRVSASAADSLANISSMVAVPQNGTSLPLGIVVASPTNYLVRAVGPSLTPFGVSNVVQSPRIHVFNTAGQELSFTTTQNVQNWPAIFTSVGAFPLTATGDNYEVIALQAGAYTISVSDSNGRGGTALLELYNNPNTSAGSSPPVISSTGQ